MNDKKSVVSKIILFSVIFFIVGGVGGYFIGANSSRGNDNFGYEYGNFQLNDTARAEIVSFFDNSPTSIEVSDYCQNNPRYCMEYCRTINPSSEICSNLDIDNFRGGMPAR